MLQGTKKLRKECFKWARSVVRMWHIFILPRVQVKFKKNVSTTLNIRTKNAIPESVLKKRKTTEKIAAARLAEAVQRKKVGIYCRCDDPLLLAKLNAL